MEEAIPLADYQALHHLPSESAGSERAVLDQVAQPTGGWEDTPTAPCRRQMEIRHRKRQAAIDSAYRKQQFNE